MNNFRNQAKKIYSNRGQSLTELAIFASIIIFAISTMVGYALSFNHNQNVAMKAFRRAQKLAGEVDKTSLNANITLVYDKAIADPQNIFGIPKRVPISFSASAVHSNELFSDLQGLQEELPRVVYDINGKVYTLTSAAFVPKTVTLNYYVPSVDSEHDPGYIYEDGSIRRKAFIDNWDGEGRAWDWEYPDDQDYKFDEKTSWDVDGDGEEETILFVDPLPSWDPHRGEMVDSMKYHEGEFSPSEHDRIVEITRELTVMDNQEGELDLTIDEPGLKNGLLADTRIIEIDKNQLINQQENGSFQTKTVIKNVQNIERRIRLNPKLEDFSSIEAQILANNPGAGSIYCDSLDADVQGGGDCILIEGDQKFLVIRSRFSTDKEAYNWARKAD